MTFIHKNETGFHWGPRATSRQGRQVEVAACVRGVFRLAPGQPLEPITDELEQGFMSGETWAPDDPLRVGPITRHSDFADWKPNTDLLLKGTCYPPGGGDVVCDVAWGVGEWSKSLRVYGARTYKPGLVFGGSVSEPQPFQRMPLDWAHAYGGAGHPLNPGGKGFDGPEMHNVEDPQAAVAKPGKKAPPATFLPISPIWPERRGKIGKKYGKSWEKKRAPFPAEDFDWSYHNCAPADQQLPFYLRGDERVWFRNLHPEASEFEVRLPALRIRVFVKRADETVFDLEMALDTLYVDLDEGRLELNWRGLCPVSELDLSDVAVVYVGKEPLAEPPLPREHYLALLAAFEDDPIGIKEKAPAGFFEIAEAVQQKDKAELYGGPMPDFAKVAAAMPKDGKIPPWAVAAFGLAGQPMEQLKLAAAAQGIELPQDPAVLKAMGEQMKAAKDDPLAMAASLREMAKDADPGAQPLLEQAADQLEQAAKLKEAQAGPTSQEDPAGALERMAEKLPPGELREAMRSAAGEVRSGLDKAKEAAARHPAAQEGLSAALAEPVAALPPPTPDEAVAQARAASSDAFRQALEQLKQSGGDPAQLAELTQAKADAEASLAGIPSLDQIVSEALSPLDQVELPEVPPLPDTTQRTLAMLDSDEAMWRERLGGDHPLLGVFDLGRRVVMGAARKLEALALPDLSAALDGLQGLADELTALGASAAAVAPLIAFKGRLNVLLDSLPGAENRPEKRDYACQELPGADFAGQELSGLSFASAKLPEANFARADLRGADLRRADLRGADLRGADLSEALLDGADLSGAQLEGATLSGAKLLDAVLSEANLRQVSAQGASLEGAILQQACLDDADLRQADLRSVQLTDTSLQRADLSEATLESALGTANFRGARMVGVKLGSAQLLKCDLREVDLSGADLKMVNLSQANAQGLIAREVCFDMANFTGSRLDGADLRKSRGMLAFLKDCDLRGADLRELDLEKCNLAGAQLSDADLSDSRLETCDLRDAVAERARFLRVRAAGCSSGGEARFTACNFVGLQAKACKWLGVDVSGSDFSYAQLRDSLWRECHGKDINFYGADLKRIVLRKANFERVSFVSADLNGVDLCESRLLDIQFTQSNLYDAKFMDAELAACDFNGAAMGMSRFDRTPGAPR